MDLVEIGGTQDEVVRRLFHAADGQDWEQLRCFWASVGGARAVWVLTLDAAGELGSAPVPDGLDGQLGALKEAMADPERGTWYLAEIALQRGGQYTVDYAYERRVYWNDESALDPYAEPAAAPQPGDDLWRVEFARYPRSAEFRPDWAPTP